MNRQVTLEGKVTKVELINPHSWIHLEVIQDGKPVVWMVEGGSPNALVRRGITKNSIPVGSELVIRGYGTRDGTNKAVGRDMKFADGRALFFGGTAAPGEDDRRPAMKRLLAAGLALLAAATAQCATADRAAARAERPPGS